MSELCLPRWDLTPIFPGVSSIEFRSALDSLAPLSARLISEVKEKAPLSKCLSTLNEISIIHTTLMAYTNALLSVDTSNTDYIKAVGDVESAALACDEAENVFISALSSYEAEFDDPEVKPFRYLLEHMLEESQHKMSLAEEALASDLARSGADAWARLFDSVSSSIGDGEKTVIQLRNDAYSPDRELRRTSYMREKKIWAEHAVSFAGALNGIKGTVLTLEKRRGWSSPLERSAFLSRTSLKAINALISTLEKNLPVFRRYFAAKAKLLGVEKLEWYDLFAPVGSSDKVYSFEAAKELIVRCYSGFDKKMGEFAAAAFDNNWIDAEPRKGKVGGAYDTAFPMQKVSRIMCNYDGSYSSVLTVAHELGHAYHDSIVLKRPGLLSDYPMTVAETASIFAEQIVFQEFLKSASDSEKVIAIEQFVGDCAQVCVDILSRFYFERSAFEKRKEGEVSAEEFCALMKKAQDDSYGEAVANKHEYMWAVKGHYYSKDFSFYNYPYAFGQLFALALYSLAKEDPEFGEKYRNLLLLTGETSANEVAASVGCDIEDEAFWQRGMDVIASYVKTLEEEAN